MEDHYQTNNTDNKDSKKPLYTIGVVAKILNMHPQTLRLYEREGFIKPSRTEGKTRLYSQEDIEKVQQILRLTRDLGVNLAGVEVILRMRSKLVNMQRDFVNLLQFLKEELKKDYSDLEDRFNNALIKAPQKSITHIETDSDPDSKPENYE